MKKQLTLLAALLFALTAVAQIDENKQQLLDYEEDTANVVSLADILKMQQEVYSKNYNRENLQQVWKRKKTFTVSHNTSRLTARKVPFYEAKEDAYNEKSYKFKSDWGFSLQSANTFRLHKKPIANTVSFGLEFSPLNLSVNHYKQMPDFAYNSSIVKDGSDTKNLIYYSPWGLEMYDISYGIHIGPSITLAPFTALKSKGLAHLRLQAYFALGYRFDIMFRSSDKDKDVNDPEAEAGDINDPAYNGTAAQTAYDKVNSSSLITWAHGLYTQFGFRINWKFNGISYEITKGDWKHKSVETKIFGSQKEKFNATSSRIGLTFFW